MNPEQNTQSQEQMGQEQTVEAPKGPETSEDLKGQVDAQKQQLQKELQDIIKRSQEWSTKQQGSEVDPALVASAQAELAKLDQEAQTTVTEADSQLDQLTAASPNPVQNSSDTQPQRFYTGDPTSGKALEFIDTDGKLAKQFAESAKKEKEMLEKKLVIPEDVKPGTLEHLTYQLRNERVLAEDKAQKNRRREKTPLYSTEDQGEMQTLDLQSRVLNDLQSKLARGLVEGPDPADQVALEIRGKFNDAGKAQAIKEGNISISDMADVVLALDDQMQDQLDRINQGEEDPGIFIGNNWYSSEAVSKAAEALISKLKGGNKPDSESAPNQPAQPETIELRQGQLSTQEAEENYNNNQQLVKRLAKFIIPSLSRDIPTSKSENDFQVTAGVIEQEISTIQELPQTEQSQKISDILTEIMNTFRDTQLSGSDRISRSMEQFRLLKSELNQDFKLQTITTMPGSLFDRKIHSVSSVVETDDLSMDGRVIRSAKVGTQRQGQVMKGGQLEDKTWLVEPESVVVYKYKKPEESVQDTAEDDAPEPVANNQPQNAEQPIVNSAQSPFGLENSQPRPESRPTPNTADQASAPAAEVKPAAATQQSETRPDQNPLDENKNLDRKGIDRVINSAMSEIRSGVDGARKEELADLLTEALDQTDDPNQLLAGATQLMLLKNFDSARIYLKKAEAGNNVSGNRTTRAVYELSSVIATRLADSGDINGARESLEKAQKMGATESNQYFSNGVKAITKRNSAFGRLFRRQ